MKNTGISGVGSSYTYIYNSQTGKLSTKDGTKDVFVDYFNGDISEGETASLNGFDANKKRDIENMIMLFSSGKARNIFDNLNGNEYEISGEIVDAVTSNYSVNGEKVFTAYNAVSYTYDEVTIFSKIMQPYKTHQSKMNQLVWGLNALIHFADQQWFSSMIDKESTPMLLELLNELGVDTNKEFIINETKCEVVNGRIKEAGNNSVVPSSLYHEAVKRYEELLYKGI